MKPEAMIVKYAPVSAPMVGKVSAVLSPEGWEATRYQSIDGPLIDPKEISEFTDVVMCFFRACNTQKELKKYVRKYGVDLDAVTSAMRLDGCFMDYLVRISGYAIVFEAYRKENM